MQDLSRNCSQEHQKNLFLKKMEFIFNPYAYVYKGIIYSVRKNFALRGKMTTKGVDRVLGVRYSLISLLNVI